MAFATRAQVPRWTTASLPETLAAWNAATLQPSETPPGWVESCTTTTGRVVPLEKVALLALSASSEAPVLSAKWPPGNVATEPSIAATESTPLAVPGEETM